MNPAANRSTTQVVIGAPHPSPAGNHRNQQHQPAPPIGVVISGVSRPVSEPLDPDSQKTFEAILAKYGIKPQTAAQSALSAAGSAAGAASSAMCLQSTAGVDATALSEQLDAARRNSTFGQMLSREENRRAAGADARNRLLYGERRVLRVDRLSSTRPTPRPTAP